MWLTVRALTSTAAVGALLALAAGFVASPSATAQDVGTPPAGATTVSFAELGRGAVDLPDTRQPIAVTIPVPDGLAPQALTASLLLPVNATAGVVDVSADNVPLTRLTVSPGDLGGQGQQVSIPLTAAPVRDRAIALTLVPQVIYRDGSCLDRGRKAMTLTAAAISYTGDEAVPSTPATFFPPVLRTTTIYLSDSMSLAQRAAALTLSTALVHRFGRASTQVKLAELTSDQQVPAAGTLNRAVVLRTGAAAGITIERGPSQVDLAITGDETTLRDQVQLLINNLTDYSASSAAGTPTTATAPQLAPDVITLADYTEPILSASGDQHVEIPLTVDQSRLGRSTRGLSLRLRGTYTPQPATYGGELSATVGGTRLVSTPLDASGRFDLTVPVPDALLTRFLTVTLAADLTGDFGCGTGSAVTLAIDPTSTIQSTAAAPPVPGGFTSLPQSVMPRVAVGIAGTSLADLVRAQRLLVGWQRLSAGALAPDLESVDDAVATEGPVLVVAPRGEVPAGVAGDLPLQDVDPGVLAVRGLPRGAASGSLQVAWDAQHSRTVVVATSTGDAADLDAVLDWWDADPTRRANLSGDVLVGSRSLTPFPLAIRVAAAGSAFTSDSTDSRSSTGALLLIVGATVAVLAVALALTVVLRRRRRR